METVTLYTVKEVAHKLNVDVDHLRSALHILKFGIQVGREYRLRERDILHLEKLLRKAKYV